MDQLLEKNPGPGHLFILINTSNAEKILIFVIIIVLNVVSSYCVEI